MRAGFVGTGWFGREHALAAKSLGLEIAGCYSTNAAKAAEFAKEFGAKVYADPREMVSRKNIDVLYLVVPPFAHDGGVELQAIKEKIPFLVEKPIGLDLAVCRRIAAEAARAGLVVSVGYLLRELSLVAEARKVIGRNRITSLRACRMSSFPGVHWWRKMDLSGGPMVEQTTHLVDLIRFVFGEVSQVAAMTSYGIGATRFDGCDVYDSMEAVMTFRTGAIGSIGLTDTFENGFSKMELFEVFGQDFYLGYNMTGLRYKEGKSQMVELAEVKDANLLLAENKRFLAAIEKGDPSAVLSPYADGLKTLELTLAMDQSAKTGAVVQVP